VSDAESPFTALLGRAAEPGLESAVLAARLGAVLLDQVLPSVASWPLIVLSSDDYRLGPEHLHPTLVQGSDGIPAVAAFTSPDRVGRFLVDGVGPVRLPGRLLARGIKPGVGIVINPESEPSILVPPSAIETLAASAGDLVARPPGSRELSALERAIASWYAASGSRDEVIAAIADSPLSLATSVEPTGGRHPDFASIGDDAERRFLAWTDPRLSRGLPESVRWVTVPGRDLPQFLGMTRVHLNPGTGFNFSFELAELSGQ
jgi:hypothetical protein